MSPVLEQFFNGLQLNGERPALIEADRQLSYANLVSEIGARADLLHRSGAKRLALALDNGIEWVLWDLAALYAGLVCVPLPGFFSADQQQHVLDHLEYLQWQYSYSIHIHD